MLKTALCARGTGGRLRSLGTLHLGQSVAQLVQMRGQKLLRLCRAGGLRRSSGIRAHFLTGADARCAHRQILRATRRSGRSPPLQRLRQKKNAARAAGSCAKRSISTLDRSVATPCNLSAAVNRGGRSCSRSPTPHPAARARARGGNHRQQTIPRHQRGQHSGRAMRRKTQQKTAIGLIAHDAGQGIGSQGVFPWRRSHAESRCACDGLCRNPG